VSKNTDQITVKKLFFNYQRAADVHIICIVSHKIVLHSALNCIAGILYSQYVIVNAYHKNIPDSDYNKYARDFYIWRNRSCQCIVYVRCIITMYNYNVQLQCTIMHFSNFILHNYTITLVSRVIKWKICTFLR
jgi:hypothetical protein